MNRLSKLLLPVGLSVLLSAAVSAENKQQSGEVLIEHAREVSNLRTADAYPFRLQATVKLAGTGEAGSYTETWASPTNWRRETLLGAYHLTEVGGAKTRWVLHNQENTPGNADRVGTIMRIGSMLDQAEMKVAAIREEDIQGVHARCVELKQKHLDGQTFCYDAQSGVLLEHQTTSLSMGKKKKLSCIYGRYEPFAGRTYPRHIQCTEGGLPGLEVTIQELASIAPPDNSLFAVPAGAREQADCTGTMQAPQVLQAVDPVYPEHEPTPISPEVLWLILDRDGKPREVKVARSIGKAFDQAAIEVVSRWKFRPATCDGEPVPVQINVEVSFRKY